MADLETIKTLRDKTQASLADCRAVLEEAGGDLARAADLLRRRGKLIAEKKSSRAANAGLIDSYVHPNGRVGVLTELRCETDFVARNDLFKNLAHDISLQVAAMNPKYLSPADVPPEAVEKERRNFSEEAKSSGKPPAVVEKIVEGKLAKFLEEQSLLTQAFIKNPERKIQDLVTDAVSQLGENIRIERFIRFEF